MCTENEIMTIVKYLFKWKGETKHRKKKSGTHCYFFSCCANSVFMICISYNSKLDSRNVCRSASWKYDERKVFVWNWRCKIKHAFIVYLWIRYCAFKKLTNVTHAYWELQYDDYKVFVQMERWNKAFLFILCRFCIYD